MYEYVLLLVCWCVCASVEAASVSYSLEDAQSHFEAFIQQFNKEYADDNEREHRFQIFKKNLQDIIRLNEESKHAEFGITQFIDLTNEEFEGMYTGYKIGEFGDAYCTTKYDKDIPDANAPESWDWREHGVVSPVKNQSVCGSCYAFSCVGQIEGQYAIKYKKQPLELSEQQIVDCDKHSIGCLGGLGSGSMRSLIEMGGIEKEDDYPYESRQNSCKFDKSKVVVKLSDCFSYRLKSQEKVKQLLYKTGPITIGVQGIPLRSYHRGILMDDDCNVGLLSHAVLLVGYGIENNIPYWIVKNSWGSHWAGEKGYFRMQRGEGAHSCGMMLEENDAMASAVIE